MQEVQQTGGNGRRQSSTQRRKGAKARRNRHRPASACLRPRERGSCRVLRSPYVLASWRPGVGSFGLAAMAQPRTPTAFYPSAQGCAPGATLGGRIKTPTTLKGLRKRGVGPDATPSGLNVFVLATQGRHCAPTLGWRTERRWRSASRIPAGFEVNSRGCNPRNRRRAAPAPKGPNGWLASAFDPCRVGDCGGGPFLGFIWGEGAESQSESQQREDLDSSNREASTQTQFFVSNCYQIEKHSSQTAK